MRNEINGKRVTRKDTKEVARKKSRIGEQEERKNAVLRIPSRPGFGPMECLEQMPHPLELVEHRELSHQEASELPQQMELS